MISDVQYWNPATGGWQTVPPTTTLGQTAGVAGYVLNRLPDMYEARLVARVAAPDGSVSSCEGNVEVIPPGYSGVWRFTWLVQQLGSYSAILQEYTDDEISDEWGPGLVVLVQGVQESTVAQMTDMILPLGVLILAGAILVPMAGRVLKGGS